MPQRKTVLLLTISLHCPHKFIFCKHSSTLLSRALTFFPQLTANLHTRIVKFIVCNETLQLELESFLRDDTNFRTILEVPCTDCEFFSMQLDKKILPHSTFTDNILLL